MNKKVVAYHFFPGICMQEVNKSLTEIPGTFGSICKFFKYFKLLHQDMPYKFTVVRKEGRLISADEYSILHGGINAIPRYGINKKPGNRIVLYVYIFLCGVAFLRI